MNTRKRKRDTKQEVKDNPISKKEKAKQDRKIILSLQNKLQRFANLANEAKENEESHATTLETLKYYNEKLKQGGANVSQLQKNIEKARKKLENQIKTVDENYKKIINEYETSMAKLFQSKTFFNDNFRVALFCDVAEIVSYAYHSISTNIRKSSDKFTKFKYLQNAINLDHMALSHLNKLSFLPEGLTETFKFFQFCIARHHYNWADYYSDLFKAALASYAHNKVEMTPEQMEKLEQRLDSIHQHYNKYSEEISPFYRSVLHDKGLAERFGIDCTYKELCDIIDKDISALEMQLKHFKKDHPVQETKAQEVAEKQENQATIKPIKPANSTTTISTRLSANQATLPQVGKKRKRDENEITLEDHLQNINQMELDKPTSQFLDEPSSALPIHVTPHSTLPPKKRLKGWIREEPAVEQSKDSYSNYLSSFRG